MRNINFFLVFVLLSSIVFTGCSLDEDPIPVREIFLANLSEEFQEWLLPFDSVGLELIYRNNEDSTATVIVERTFTQSEQNYLNCTINDQLAECEFNSVNIAFPEDTHPDNFQTYISLFLFAPNDLQVMANRIGVTPAIARFNANTEEIISEFTDNYNSAYQTDYIYRGSGRSAITVETTSLENAPDGAIIAPKRIVLVKGFGLIEWEDYNGNKWVLID